MRSGPVFCFDLDDTLISEEDYVESGLCAAGGLIDALTPPAGERAGDRLVQLWRAERASDGFQRLLQERNLDPGWWLPKLKQAYRDHEPILHPRVGATDLLSVIVGRGGKLALVSDGWLEVQRRKWSALALPFPFNPVVFTDERGRDYWKPHSWSFEQVMAAHPTAARFFYVGDNPAKDFIAPNRLGWTTVLVRDGRNLHSSAVCEDPNATSDLVVESLDEISGIVQQIL